MLATAASLVVTMLTGCASATETYCGTLGEEQQQLKDLAEGADDKNADIFGETLSVFDELQSEAPDDIVDEWDTLIFALEGLVGALDDAGLNAGEYELGGTPDGATPEQMSAVQTAAEELRSEQVLAAGKGIEDHARDVCDVELTL